MQCTSIGNFGGWTFRVNDQSNPLHPAIVDAHQWLRQNLRERTAARIIRENDGKTPKQWRRVIGAVQLAMGSNARRREGEPAVEKPKQYPPRMQADIERLASDLGLSTSHISPRGSGTQSKFACEVAIGGGIISVKGQRLPRASQTGGERGEVKGFSRGSRRRMMRKMASIDRRAIDETPIFVTLTYPNEWPSDPKIWKRDLDAFGKRLLRRYSNACAIWKLEPQKRGAPHYHLIVLNVPHVDKTWLAHAWYEVVASGDEKHLRAGTRVEAMRSWNGCMSYASKYTAKVVEDLPPGWDTVGRMWGIIGRKNLPITVVRFEVSKPQFVAIRDFLWGLVGGPPPKWIQYETDGMTAMIDWDQGAQTLQRILQFENESTDP